MPGKKHILVMRFSSMGDVAMTVPVVKALLAQNPELQITYISRPQFAGFFANIPNLNFFTADLDNNYKGFRGIAKLYRQLKKLSKYDAVADLHDSLRTKILRRLFSLTGTPYAFIDKGRAEKKLLTRFPNKSLKPLKRTVERYADVFRGLGYVIELGYKLTKQPQPLTADIIAITGDKAQPWVGISPFAKHVGKTYPREKMDEVINELSRQDIKVFLFAGSPIEKEICESWAAVYENVISVVRRLSMEQELIFINNLDVMLSMDSAGMHLASLEGTAVVSIWGATHHYAGFLGYGQSEDNIVANDIECRPCSVYGDRPCFRKDYACMHRIQTKMILERLNKFTSL
jgi:ADP-heptose:LPS heptosyltransferase